MDFLDELVEGLEGERAERAKEQVEQFRRLKAEADFIAGEGGSTRFLKLPLLYGIGAALVFLGLVLIVTKASVLGGILFVLAGIPILLVSAILFAKMKKTQSMYKELQKIQDELEEMKKKTVSEYIIP